MKHLWSFLVCLSIYSIGFAQQGKATYLEYVKMSFSFDSTTNAKMTDKMREDISNQIKSQSQKEYTLTFTPIESLYKQEERLNTPTPNSGSMVSVGNVFITTSGGSDVLYKNTKEAIYLNRNELMGKVFLIKDTLPRRPWKLGTETKKIGNYNCYNATMEYTITRTKFNLGENNDETIEKTKTITAWYTPEIPVSNGPEDYQGLPGLILEIHDGNKTLVCNKVMLSNTNHVEIKAPSKGKQVTQKEYDQIKAKKMKQFLEQHSNTNRKGDGISITISK